MYYSKQQSRFAAEYGPKRGALGTGPRRDEKRAVERAKLQAVRKKTRDLHEASRLGLSLVELEQKRQREIAAARMVAKLPPAVIEPGDPIADTQSAIKKPRKTAAKKEAEAPSAGRRVSRAIDFNLNAADKPQSKRVSKKAVQ